MTPAPANQEVAMIAFPVHTPETAPPSSQRLLRGLRASLGEVPNLAASMAESPELLEGFLQIRKILYAGTFSPAEVQVLALTNAFENGCEYCMALHTAFALREGVSAPSVEALRRGLAPLEPKLRELSDLSRQLVQQRGRVGGDTLAAFLAAGYTRGQALEVVLGVAVSILPNFAHHLTACPLDEIFLPHAWSGAS
jgi:AhpD family alkylhydroperoxidase